MASGAVLARKVLRSHCTLGVRESPLTHDSGSEGIIEREKFASIVRMSISSNQPRGSISPFYGGEGCLLRVQAAQILPALAQQLNLLSQVALLVSISGLEEQMEKFQQMQMHLLNTHDHTMSHLEPSKLAKCCHVGSTFSRGSADIEVLSMPMM